MKLALSCLACAVLAPFAHADVKAPYTYSEIRSLADAPVSSSDFGTLTRSWSLVGTGLPTADLAEGKITTGMLANGVPFITATDSTNVAKAVSPAITASVTYFWEIVRRDGQPTDEFVPVTLSSMGTFHTLYEYVPNTPGAYNVSPNYVWMGMAATFGTLTNTGFDRHALGRTMGGYNWGVPNIPVPPGGQSQYTYKATVDGGFDESFTVMAMPGVENYIAMQVDSLLYTNSSYPSQYGTELYAVSMYLDPIITIDAAYADRYELKVSAFPASAMAVPEPGTWALMLGGVGVLAAWRRRREA